MKNKLPKLIVVLGPTASGKTELAIKLAKKFNGEIICADSRQVYKEMDIGTAKPSKEEQDIIPHHLIDVVWLDKKFNVAIYKKIVLKVIKNIQKRKKIPFLVGGTGLYIRAIVDNIEFPKVPPQKELRKKLEKKSKKELFEIYKKIDPKGAKFIEKENKRRLIRAIEVCKVTGKSFWQQRKKGKLLFDVFQIGIKLTKKELKKRISKRVKQMFKLGLEKEAKHLIEKYGWISSLQTIGYQEWKEYFEEKISKEKVKELIERHTFQFVKRQITWFKKDNNIHWVSNCKQADKLIRNFLKK